jgi:hypothetical protein
MVDPAFGIISAEDADPELQKQHPEAMFFIVSRKNLGSFVLFEQRELLILNMHRQNNILFERQDEDYLGQTLFVGKLAIFEREIDDDQRKKEHYCA